jgi:hypothetical protein
MIGKYLWNSGTGLPTEMQFVETCRVGFQCRELLWYDGVKMNVKTVKWTPMAVNLKANLKPSHDGLQ